MARGGEAGGAEGPTEGARHRRRAAAEPRDALAAGAPAAPRRRLRPLRWLLRLGIAVIGLVVAAVALLAAVDPPTTPYMLEEGRRLGGVEQDWVALSTLPAGVARAAVAAEDANFCAHWGIDVGAVRAALAEGGDRGASTISQQVTKNVFLWQGRSWTRKALEAAITPLVEAVWTKRRILEVYLNVAEFGEGVFGVEAAARHHFGVAAAELSDGQAALLAAILPSPRTRDPAQPTAAMERRAAQILDGAATIARDGRAACFEAPEG